MHFKPMGFCKFICAITVVCLGFPGMTALEGQEVDKGFRDFGFTVEPSELLQRLSVFQPQKSEENSFDAEKYKDLAMLRQRLLSEMSDEQRAEVQKFAEQYLSERGLESESSRALMRELGIPNSLVEQFKNMAADPAVGDRGFRDAVSKALQSSGNLRVDQSSKKEASVRKGASNASEPGKGIGETKGDVKGVGSGEGEIGRTPVDEANEPNDSFAKDTQQPEDVNARKVAPNLKDENQGAGLPRGNKVRGELENGKPSDPLGLDTEAGRLNDRPIENPQNRSTEKNGLSLEPDKGAEEEAPGIGLSESASRDNKKSGQMPWEEDINQILGLKSQETVDSKTDVLEDSQGTGIDRSSKVGKTISNKLADLVNNPAFFEGIRQGNADESGGETTGDGGENKPRLASVFDRTVVEAARGVMKSSNEGGDDDRGFLARNFDSFFKKIVNSTENSEAIDEGVRESRKFISDDEGWDNKGRSGGGGRVVRSDWLKFDDAQSSRGQTRSERRSGTRTSSLIGSESRKPTDTSSEGEGVGIGASSGGVFTLLFGLIIGAVIFAVLYALLNRRSNSVSKIVSDRVVNRRIDRANFESSQDLIALVDLFLLNKFGSESGWWNAKHAESVLHADAPEIEANISDLVRSYVRLRYTRSGDELTQTERDNCKRTLKSLSKVLSKTDLSTRLRVEG